MGAVGVEGWGAAVWGAALGPSCCPGDGSEPDTGSLCPETCRLKGGWGLGRPRPSILGGGGPKGAGGALSPKTPCLPHWDSWAVAEGLEWGDSGCHDLQSKGDSRRSEGWSRRWGLCCGAGTLQDGVVLGRDQGA